MEDVARQPSGRGARQRDAAAWLAGAGAVLALAFWTRALTPGWLIVSAGGGVLWLVAARGVGRVRRALVGVALTGAVVTGAVAQLRLAEVAHDWPRLRARVEERAATELRAGLDDLVDRAERAVNEVAAVGSRIPDGVEVAQRQEPFRELDAVRRRNGISALALYGPDGSPLAWAGEHRGSVPDSVRYGLRRYSYSAGPLFGYVYFTRRAASGRTAVAAVLLEAHLFAGGEARPFAERFGARFGVTPRFTTPDRAQGPVVWDWTLGSPILSVVFASLNPEAWRARIAARGRLVVLVFGAAALLLLTAGWLRHRPGAAPAPIVLATAFVLALPLREMRGGGLFTPLDFALAGPAPLSLGEMLVLLCGVALLALASGVPGTWQRRRGVAVGAARVGLAAVLLVAVDALVRASAGPALLAREPAGGPALFGALALLCALLLFPLLSSAPEPRRWWRTRLLAALTLAAVLAAAVVLRWAPDRALPVGAAALWALPFALLVWGGVPRAGARHLLIAWLAVGWIGGSLAAAQLWFRSMDARIAAAEREIGALGVKPDPFLDFLLREFAEKALFYAAEGREGVSLLYQSWAEAGLAREGYEASISLWEGSRRVSELPMSTASVPAALVPGILRDARASEEPTLRRYTAYDSLQYLLAVPLPGGRTVMAAVPPRRDLGRTTTLSRFLATGEPAPALGEGAALSLVPAAALPPSDAAPALGGPTRWMRAPEGWRSETTVPFPSGPMHAHLRMRTPSTALLIARGLLAQLLLLMALTMLWAVARLITGESLRAGAGRWFISFRGRLTLALFGFFMLPTVAFGGTVFRAFAREVRLTAEALASHALSQIAAEIGTAPLGVLGNRLGTEVLFYHGGALTEGTAPELIELGLYPTWLPEAVYLDFVANESAEARSDVQQLAGARYLVAYRRLGVTDVLAAPAPLAIGDAARRQREFASLLLLAGLLGAAFSVFLALVVGRALSRPIDHLSVAASAVGTGDLDVRLPPRGPDEFGGLFRAFNRMVRRLRRARAALERETRRTEAIVAEAGTGVLALDAAGRVALINRRACELLRTEIGVGDTIPADAPLAATIAAAVERFLASGHADRAEEHEVDGRTLRLRFRRLAADDGPRGAVLVLEDVTREIHTARVLAWGEMARQVAHEIKNPLTPIKLAVQHIRRAYADRRADFDQILTRNVDAVLREIDQLGEIARAFARFGTPADPAQPPVPVDLRAVVRETLALYRGGDEDGGVRYRSELPGDLPRAYAREGELKEVLVNLIENARAALPHGGEVRVSAALTDDGHCLRLDLADTGEGIPPEQLPRIFDPHFSTRSSGTGLGLAIVKRLVESWGGSITVESTPGAGTTVHLTLRVADTVSA